MGLHDRNGDSRVIRGLSETNMCYVHSTFSLCVQDVEELSRNYIYAIFDFVELNAFMLIR